MAPLKRCVYLLFTQYTGLCVYVRAGSVSVFGVGIGIQYFRRYFFHVGSVSVFLKYWLKIANFWYSPLFGRFGATVEGDGSRRKIRMMGPPGNEKSLIVSLAVSIHQRDKQTDTARQQRPHARYDLRRAVNIYAFSHYVVLFVFVILYS